MNQNMQRLKDINEGKSNPRGFSFFKYFNVKIKKIMLAEIEGEFVVAPEFLNGIETLHGGSIAALADECSGLVTYTLGVSKKFPTLSISVNYLRPAFKNDQVTINGKIVKRGKKIVFTEVTFYKKDKLLAKAFSNHSVVD